ncbi:hypothetical protein EYF80_033563 [Liparis tanakae]|uniref:Uncharacterized protein n=1 Tax=Liparis tanakae TaxID=230148 RepID=A0A4Z2GRI7_9TELE|nr:hypothetical protein EYF80_033563 [Liparis tanakae]
MNSQLVVEDGLPPLGLPEQTPLSLLQALLVHLHVTQDHLTTDGKSVAREKEELDGKCGAAALLTDPWLPIGRGPRSAVEGSCPLVDVDEVDGLVVGTYRVTVSKDVSFTLSSREKLQHGSGMHPHRLPDEQLPLAGRRGWASPPAATDGGSNR